MQAYIGSNPYGAAVLAAGSVSAAGSEVFLHWLQSELPALASRYKLCWLSLAPAETGVLTAVLAAGFQYHHIRDDILTLVYRLQSDAYLPLAATHSIGVGAAVFNARGEILLVREQPVPGGKTGYFKLPGGMVEPYEHFVSALEREVAEETGVLATFRGWLAMRHHHQGQFGASNLYLVGRLDASTLELKPDPREIAEAAWFDPQAFLADPLAHPYNKLLVRAALDGQLWPSAEFTDYQAGPRGFELFQAKNRSLSDPAT